MGTGSARYSWQPEMLNCRYFLPIEFTNIVCLLENTFPKVVVKSLIGFGIDAHLLLCRCFPHLQRTTTVVTRASMLQQRYLHPLCFSFGDEYD